MTFWILKHTDWNNTINKTTPPDLGLDVKEVKEVPYGQDNKIQWIVYVYEKKGDKNILSMIRVNMFSLSLLKY